MSCRRQRWARPAIVGGVIAAALATACVFGFRGEVEFADEAELAGLQTVQIEVPPTTLTLRGDPDRTFVDWAGTWASLGGGSNEALETARKAEMRWETWEEVGRLSPQLPLEIRDITSLDHLDVDSAAYLAHEIHGTGDVSVTGIDAYLLVDLDGGDVEILGGLEQIVVDNSRGDLSIASAAAVDAKVQIGAVDIESEAPRELLVDTVGPVTIQLSDADDLTLDIADAGRIIVELDSAAHVGSGSYTRTVGDGDRRIRVRAGGGPVEISMLPLVP